MNKVRNIAGYDDHEKVFRFEDKKVGLRGFIAIHNTNQGPATGGTRFKIYDTEDDAMKDALDLSRAMTYKCAMAGVPYGGGKAVIIKPSARFPGRAGNLAENKGFLESYVSVVNSLGGDFTTGKDVGIGDQDVVQMARISPYVNGHTGSEDPSIYAALGVFLAIRQVLAQIRGSASLNGVRIAVKGLGQVGLELARLIFEAGGKLIVADIDEGKVDQVRELFKGIKVVSPAEIHKSRCDIYAPCAMGGEFNEVTIGELGAKMICGAANNQLADPSMGVKLLKRGIIYVPDYVANAGGLIAVVDGFRYKKFNDLRVRKNLSVIEDNVNNVLDLSIKTKRPTQELADELARSIIYG